MTGIHKQEQPLRSVWSEAATWSICVDGVEMRAWFGKMKEARRESSGQGKDAENPL